MNEENLLYEMSGANVTDDVLIDYLRNCDGIGDNFKDSVCLLNLLPSVCKNNSSKWRLLFNFSPELLNNSFVNKEVLIGYLCICNGIMGLVVILRIMFVY